jgi:hypothetical protein
MNAKLAKEVLNKLKDAGFVSAVVHYDGSGDSGQVEEISVFRKDEPESYSRLVEEYTWEKVAALRDERDVILRAIPITLVSRSSTFDRETLKFVEKETPTEGNLYEALEMLAYDWLEDEHGGWENNDGAYGDLVVHVQEMMITLEHSERIMDVSTSSHTFACEMAKGEE